MSGFSSADFVDTLNMAPSSFEALRNSSLRASKRVLRDIRTIKGGSSCRIETISNTRSMDCLSAASSWAPPRNRSTKINGILWSGAGPDRPRLTGSTPSSRNWFSSFSRKARSYAVSRENWPKSASLVSSPSASLLFQRASTKSFRPMRTSASMVSWSG